MTLSAIILSKTPSLSSRLEQSLSFADEILVIYSDPKSGAKNHHQTRFVQHDFKNFSDHRNFGLKKAKGDWVLFVDTDEIVSKQLANEIIKLLPVAAHRGYLLKRLDTVFHQVLLHGETGHTQILRLAQKKAGKFVRDVHEKWDIKGTIGQLSNPLYHCKDHFVSEFLARLDLYCQIDAQSLKREGKPFSYPRLLFNPKAKFIYNYFLKQGFLDGLAGLFQAYLMSVQSLSVRVFQWENKF